MYKYTELSSGLDFPMFLLPQEPYFLSMFISDPFLLLSLPSASNPVPKSWVWVFRVLCNSIPNPQYCSKIWIASYSLSTSTVCSETDSGARGAGWLVSSASSDGWHWPSFSMSLSGLGSPSMEHLPLSTSYRQKTKIELFHVWHHPQKLNGAGES